MEGVLSGTNHSHLNARRDSGEVFLTVQSSGCFFCLELGAFGACGDRNPSNGSFNNGGTEGNYWSSDQGGNGAWNMEFNSSNINVNSNDTGYGFSVRLFREESVPCGRTLLNCRAA